MVTSSPFETPARRPRRSSTGGRTGDRSRRNSSILGSGTESELTPSGVQILHAGVRRSGRAITLQVLGVYRYVADPALRRVLPARAASALQRDAFDLLLSDGQMKMKALLSPVLNDLVWQGRVAELSVVEIDDYELISINDDDEDGNEHLSKNENGSSSSQYSQHAHSQPRARSVCVIHELDTRSFESSGTGGTTTTTSHMMPRSKILYSGGSGLLASPAPRSSTAPSSAAGEGAPPELQFVSHAHIRDHGTLPLAGGRLYYLSLLSDDYPHEWEPLQCEPLTPVAQAIPWTLWDRRRRYCTDLFSGDDRVVHTIREVNVLTTKSGRKRSVREVLQENDADEAARPAPPPMVGVVHFKSGLIHLGDEDVANAFPFMFLLVVSDKLRALEVAFFGSMAAKHFLTVQQGDVVELQGYTVDRSQPRRKGEKPRKIFLFPHLSTGFVSHVPEKYWYLLERTKVLPLRPRLKVAHSKRRADDDDDDDDDDSDDYDGAPIHSSVWINPVLITTNHSLKWDLVEKSKSEHSYFDFVGVVSFAGRVHRHRDANGPIDGSSSWVRAFRWIKVVDSSCDNELVVRVFVNSQPAAFQAIQAGDVVMLSRLQWRDTRHGDKGVEFATTSLYSVIRRNDDLEPFTKFPECSKALQFAEKLQSNTGGGGVKTVYSTVDSPLVATTESWLEGPGIPDWSPVCSALAMSDTTVQGLALLDGHSHSNDDATSHWIAGFDPHESVPSTRFTTGIGFNYPFDKVAALAESMDALSHRYVRVHVALHDVRLKPTTTSVSSQNTTPEIELLISDGAQESGSLQAIRVCANVLLNDPPLPSPLDELLTREAEPLVRLLSSSAVASLRTAAILRSTELPQFAVSPAKTKLSVGVDSEEDDAHAHEMTFEDVRAFILKHRQGHNHDHHDHDHHDHDHDDLMGRVGGMDIALHLYRNLHGDLDLWIDSISL